MLSASAAAAGTGRQGLGRLNLARAPPKGFLGESYTTVDEGLKAHKCNYLFHLPHCEPTACGSIYPFESVTLLALSLFPLAAHVHRRNEAIQLLPAAGRA